MAYVIGLTGGIGSGKTQVSNMLQAQGITVFDADVIARQLVEPGSQALSAIVEHFGDHLMTASGRLDRQCLRKIIFNDASAKQWLEALLHPLIYQELSILLSTVQSAYGVLVSPLLLEGGQRQLVDWVVVVDAEEQQQLDRAQQRDNTDATAIEAIMKTQLARQLRLQQADYVIDNTGNIEHLKVQVANMQAHVKTMLNANKPHSCIDVTPV